MARLEQDPRLDPRLAAALKETTIVAPIEEPEVGADYATCVAFFTAQENHLTLIGQDQDAQLGSDFSSVVQSTEVISGVNGNEITLHIHRPVVQDSPVPGIVHLHGGGMVVGSAADPGNVHYRNALANAGMVVIGVEFRNGAGRLGNHPFPAGLNDCASAVQWSHKNRERLGIAAIIVSGESGGGNLSLATALKANQEGWVDQIDGVYAQCPYISGQYAEPPGTLPSLVECEGYILTRKNSTAGPKVYDPNGEHSMNPLAWPMQAQQEDLRGLPPHVISVNELDPLRDEGLTYYRKLLAAGVAAVGRTVNGTPHAGELLFAAFVPDVFEETLSSVSSFAHRLSQ